MSKRDTAIRALCRSLGADYTVTTIDFEKVVYRDFGNGFNVEISGMHTAKKDKKADIYLWYGDKAYECMIVKHAKNVAREDIGITVEELLDYSNRLIAQGYGDRDRLWRMKHRITNCMRGGRFMRRIFYGDRMELTDGDRRHFSRNGYECRRLMLTAKGKPVAISQKTDADFPVWKVEYDTSCLVFGTLDEAMAFCRGRFTDLDGKAVQP